MRFHLLLTFLRRRRFWLLQGAILLVFLVRILDSYSLVSATYDEHAHVGRGMQWLETGLYRADGFQAPLPRLFFGILPHREGYSSQAGWLIHDWSEQTAEDYWRSLTLARVGNLPFALILFAVAGLWSSQLFGPRAGLAATAALTASPSILGHAGLATLDIGGTAGVVFALWMLWRWGQRPTLLNAGLAGTVMGLAQASKFSSLGFVLPGFLFALWMASRNRASARLTVAQIGLMGAAGFAAIWACYGFESGPVFSWRHEQAIERGDPIGLGERLQGVSLPAPVFWQGFVDMAYLQREGFPAFLLGEMRMTGWRFYFPVTVALKCTPAILLLGLLGGVTLALQPGRRTIAAYLSVCILGILAISIPSRVNIGIRHVLPLIPLLGILGAGVFAAGSRRAGKIAAAALLVWHGVESAAAHPDHIAYMTPMARRYDYYYLSDSNLDWGQDRARLGQWLVGKADYDMHVPEMETGDILNLYEAPQGSPESEWIVVGANQLILIQFGGHRQELAHLIGAQPVERIGRSILVFRFPKRRNFNR